jgi:photosystem II stability/assembly factor-like uncharacterized protein
MKFLRPFCFIFLAICSITASMFTPLSLYSQKKNGIKNESPAVNPAMFSAMKWRNIGPFRGGRSLAVCGVASEPNTYYFGATGGGIWKTTDGGDAWINISDKFLTTASVGAIKVAPSDANVIYAGLGECDIRGNISYGDGIVKSVDAGKTWHYIGLKECYAIGKIAVHPQNADIVYAAAMGRIFGTNSERGVFRSKNGGATWEKILFKNDSTGAIDVQIDPFNPRTVYAALWQTHRNAYQMESGGMGSSLWKSTDGGDTWEELTRNAGLPIGLVGKIRIAASPAKQGRIWIMFENEHGGVFLTDDGGKTWTRTNDDRTIRQRAWYFSHIIADPKSENTVYVLNVGWYKSIDGGRTFQGMGSMHGDHHDLWIAPDNPQRMILADDGGATVSSNGGKNWTELDIPTAQFYHATLDNQFPYRVYGAQQDNSSVGIASRTLGYSIDKNDWFVAAGGESGYLAVDPLNNNIIYGGNYGGYLTKLNRTTEQSQEVSVYPENPVGNAPETHKYRFQWTYPIIFSPHDGRVLYACGNHVFRSNNEGMSWEIISPDLTTNDKSKQKASGGMITKDNTGVETYCTIFTFAESPTERGVLWAGSDDGLVHISRDNGKNWTNITPKDLPHSALISIIEPSHFDPGTAYLAATRYKSADDQTPYLYRTKDFGATWKLITTGIPAHAYTRVIREDVWKKGLLYAGTETGLFVSFNNGAEWQPLQLNLPITPIHDLAIHSREKDLVAATHGRSFWILDDLTPLHEIMDKKAEIERDPAYLFPPRHTYRIDGGSYHADGMQTGENPPNGVMIHYYLPVPPPKELQLQFLDSKDSLIITYSNKKDLKGEPLKESKEFYPNPEKKIPGTVSADSGLNRFVWNMEYPAATEAPGVMWGASTDGPKVVPGRYSVRLKLGDSLIAIRQFEVRKDPRITTTDEDFTAQFDLLMKINKKVSETHDGINSLRDIRSQIATVLGKITDSTKAKPIKEIAKFITDTLSAVEEELVQTKAKSGQDLLNFPMKLNNKLAALTSTVASADTRPTKQAYQAYEDISGRIDFQLNRMKKALEALPKLNQTVKDADIPAVKEKAKNGQ